MADDQTGPVEPAILDAYRQGLRADAAERFNAVSGVRTIARLGRVIRASGEIVSVSGLPAPTGARCLIEGADGSWLPAEVVGFDAEALKLMPENGTQGITRGARVRQEEATKRPVVGWGLLGRIIDGEGEPLDGGPPPDDTDHWPLRGQPINPMDREPIEDVFDCGVRIVNAMTTLGTGMRMGLFAGSGVGKSTLLGMMARHCSADIVVVAMIGERGREVREFIDKTLGADALGRAVVVAAPADCSALSRIHAAHRASAIAEFFRAQGQHVLLLMDSLTRLAMAGREVGLAIGEPQAMRGYPPSTFSLIASYLERAGQGRRGEGSITGIYTVLVEGDDHVADPVADTARATLDGHIVLNRSIAESGLYPPIDIEASLSRVMNDVASPEHRQAAQRVRSLWSRLQAKRDLIDIGAYQPGADPLLDEAMDKRTAMEHLLIQNLTEGCDLAASVAALRAIIEAPGQAHTASMET
ncbi:FliI/YscN family ATPase [Salinisphaera sp. RV14]|uniref:FliI/YscN family ATPase n=1 Tax=unclassified Salinisphaera TaxID=2649847 RepID=UPI003F82D9ED